MGYGAAAVEGGFLTGGDEGQVLAGFEEVPPSVAGFL